MNKTDFLRREYAGQDASDLQRFGHGEYANKCAHCTRHFKTIEAVALHERHMHKETFGQTAALRKAIPGLGEFGEILVEALRPTLTSEKTPMATAALRRNGVDKHKPKFAPVKPPAKKTAPPEKKKMSLNTDTDKRHKVGRKKSRRLARDETYKITKLLELHLVKRDDLPGTFSYADGWSDLRIANEVAIDLHEGHVQALRKEVFGNIIAPHGMGGTKAPKKAEVFAAVENLGAEMRSLAERVEKLTAHFNKLVERLSQKVALGEGWPTLKV